LKSKEDKVDFTYKTNPHLADTIKNIIYSYNASRHLLNGLFKPNTSNDEVDKTIASFRELESYWIRVHELEKFLNIHFHPRNINDELEDQRNIEELYLLLVKKMPIRENLNDLTITIKHNDLFIEKDLKKKDKYGMTFNETYEYKIYGEEFSIFFAAYIFNAIVDCIDDNQEKQEYVIKCVGTDSEPLYKVYKGFKTLDEAQSALDDLGKFNNDFANAKSFNDIM
jgi:hypothetical protein